MENYHSDVVSIEETPEHSNNNDAPQRTEEPEITTRNCLSCGQDFPSQGIHNRLCGRCRGRR